MSVIIPFLSKWRDENKAKVLSLKYYHFSIVMAVFSLHDVFPNSIPAPFMALVFQEQLDLTCFVIKNTFVIAIYLGYQTIFLVASLSFIRFLFMPLPRFIQLRNYFRVFFLSGFGMKGLAFGVILAHASCFDSNTDCYSKGFTPRFVRK